MPLIGSNFQLSKRDNFGFKGTVLRKKVCGFAKSETTAQQRNILYKGNSSTFTLQFQ